MRLLLNGWTLPLAQLGPDFAILAEAPRDHGVAHAEIEVLVDDIVDRFAIHLPVGLTAGEKRIRISPMP